MSAYRSKQKYYVSKVKPQSRDGWSSVSAIKAYKRRVCITLPNQNQASEAVWRKDFSNFLFFAIWFFKPSRCATRMLHITTFLSIIQFRHISSLLKFCFIRLKTFQFVAVILINNWEIENSSFLFHSQYFICRRRQFTTISFMMFMK